MPEDKTFAIKVYGCQMNVYDGDRIRAAMTSYGWREVDDADDADWAVFITCSIRDKAEQKVISELGRFRPMWRANGRPRVALLGCMAQRTGRSVAEKFPWVSVVSGPRHIGSVPAAMMRDEGGCVFMFDDDPHALDDLSCAPVPRANAHKAYVTIAHGCDQFCTYCIVPYVRGRFASRAPRSILGEIESLVRGGAREITLLGQNVNTYGKDIGTTFAAMLGDAARTPGLARLRFVTSHPIDFTDDILDTMVENKNICPSINLPVQAGNDRILREMNRKYTRAQYTDVVRKIRAALPGCGLTTDMIAGFPGETDAEFEDSLSLLEEIRFDLVHSAAYSPRQGTPAAARDDQVPERVRAERLGRINALQSKISAEINAALVGTECEVLIDEAAPKGEGLLQGRTATDKVVLVRADSSQIGCFRSVRITSSSPWCLEGELL